MALKTNVTLTDNFGIDVTINDVYIKVALIEGSKDQLIANVFYYKEPNGTVLHRNQFSFAPSLEGLNFIAQSYEHLKTLPEFAGAADV